MVQKHWTDTIAAKNMTARSWFVSLNEKFLKFKPKTEQDHSISQLSNLELILKCTAAQEANESDCMHKIHHKITSLGVCTVINSAPLDTKEVNRLHQRGMLNKFHFNKGVKAEEPWDISTLTLLIDHHNLNSYDNRTRGFTILDISDQFSNADMHGANVALVAGTRTNVKVQGFTLATKRADIKSLPFRSRTENGCYYTDEQPLENSMYDEYRQKNCLIECRINMAIEELNCVPWDIDFPINGRDYPRVCFADEARLFKDSLYEISLNGSCHCPDDCEVTRYSYSIDTSQINPYEECSYDDILKLVQNKHMRRTYQLELSLNKGYYIGDDIVTYYCHEKLLNDITILDIEMKASLVEGIERRLVVQAYDISQQYW